MYIVNSFQWLPGPEMSRPRSRCFKTSTCFHSVSPLENKAVKTLEGLFAASSGSCLAPAT